MPMLHARNDGPIEIYWEAKGHGDPVVLVGGLTSTVETWGRQVPALAAHHRVVTADNRGSGRTRAPAAAARDASSPPARQASATSLPRAAMPAAVRSAWFCPPRHVAAVSTCRTGRLIRASSGPARGAWRAWRRCSGC